MKCFENEELILASENNRVVLTTRRIRQAESKTDLTSIMLEKVSSVEVRYRRWIVILLTGIVCIGTGCFLLVENRQEAVLLLGIGALCVLAYFLTRKHIVSISSDGGARIFFTTRGMSKETVLDFVERLEEAKSKLHGL